MQKTLTDGTQYTKATYWEEKDLSGVWLATYKIDGLRLIRGKDNKIYSRDSKEAIHDLSGFKFNDAEFFYKVSDFYHPNDEGGLLWNDPEVGIDWPIKDESELNIIESDQNWPKLSELK